MPVRACSAKLMRTPKLAARSTTIRLAMLPTSKKLPAKVDKSARP